MFKISGSYASDCVSILFSHPSHTSSLLTVFSNNFSSFTICNFWSTYCKLKWKHKNIFSQIEIFLMRAYIILVSFYIIHHILIPELKCTLLDYEQIISVSISSPEYNPLFLHWLKSRFSSLYLRMKLERSRNYLIWIFWTWLHSFFNVQYGNNILKQIRFSINALPNCLKQNLLIFLRILLEIANFLSTSIVFITGFSFT